MLTGASADGAGPVTTEPLTTLNLLPWHGQLTVPPDTLETVQPWWVHTAVNAWNEPARGWVITIFLSARILPPPTGTSEVRASDGGWPEAGWGEDDWPEAGWGEAGWPEAGWPEAGWPRMAWSRPAAAREAQGGPVAEVAWAGWLAAIPPLPELPRAHPASAAAHAAPVQASRARRLETGMRGSVMTGLLSG
jgi:hypothetical protein